MRTTLLALFLLCGLPAAAGAQWATSLVEHDWRLTMGESSFGLVQTAIYTSSLDDVNHRTTTIVFGPWQTTTYRFTAVQIAGAVLIFFAVGGAFVVYWTSRRRSKP